MCHEVNLYEYFIRVCMNISQNLIISMCHLFSAKNKSQSVCVIHIMLETFQSKWVKEFKKRFMSNVPQKLSNLFISMYIRKEVRKFLF